MSKLLLKSDMDDLRFTAKGRYLVVELVEDLPGNAALGMHPFKKGERALVMKLDLKMRKYLLLFPQDDKSLDAKSLPQGILRVIEGTEHYKALGRIDRTW